MKLCDTLFLLGVILTEGAFVAADFKCNVDKRFTEPWCGRPTAIDPRTGAVLSFTMARAAARSSDTFACKPDPRIVLSCCKDTFTAGPTDPISSNVYGNNCDPNVGSA
ncbi:hypothetical protein Pst134EA_000339 [Puccinia striiformis f. sp. tritici]|uniref:hypothetical protein n=1 Tax=Puccinia striiformis f. sp. tritici TaxID=168172 RepID=UPI0020084EB8|nr:hypothetical protein Pst134EA_000339 [Puccinia striiformis f. sp. tritici]KAH9473265.1 hypothetical protein Pst134EA_000339 [Puccinia striiformis f. sp. tritici]